MTAESSKTRWQIAATPVLVVLVGVSNYLTLSNIESSDQPSTILLTAYVLFVVVFMAALANFLRGVWDQTPRGYLAVLFASGGLAALLTSYGWSVRGGDSWWEDLWLEMGAALVLAALIDIIVEFGGRRPTSS